MSKAYTINILIVAFLLQGILVGLVCAEDSNTHGVYKVTSYNLGAILEAHEKNPNFDPEDFRPLMITSTTSDILSSEHQGVVSWVETDSHTTATNGIALSAEFQATEKVSLQGAFGVTRNLWAPDSIDYEKESSWEANLGIIYKLINNLSYEIHFGYMDTGDLFTDQATYTGVESIIMVSNRLTMSF